MRPDKTDPGMTTRTPPPNTEPMEGEMSWQDIKSRFVDDPAGALAAAEELVRRSAEQRIRALKEEVAALCVRDDSRNTEDLRTRLLKYQEYCQGAKRYPSS